MADQNQEMGKMEARIVSLENRLSRLETVLLKSGREYALIPSDQQAPALNPLPKAALPEEESKGLESQIGRFGLAWIGNIVLLFGITFLTQYLVMQGHQYVSVVLGYISVILIYLLAVYLKKSNEHLAFMFRINSQMLLYYISLRLYFFSAAPVIPDKTVVLVLLLLITILQVYVSVRDKSQAFAILSIFFSLTTAIVGESSLFLLPLIILTAIGSCLYYYHYNWRRILNSAIILTYISFFLWMIGNPFMNGPHQVLPEKTIAVFCVFVLGLCYSLLLLMRTKDDSADDFLAELTFLNGILFTILLAFVVLKFYIKDYVGIFTILTACCLIYSTVLHSRSDWNFASAFYALYGFMAMSIALYGMVGFPKVYLLLSGQSLIVVSMALWFRNRLIVIMNSMLFLTILLVYLLSSKQSSPINFSFAMIALISARVINWKRDRLQIKTEMMRNLYMLAGFFMVLFALGHAVPRQFITLSWTMAAFLYFLLGYLLKNKKYRYMALGTMICSAFYLFIFDLARIEIIYRVLALLFLAAISIGISIYYTNRIRKQDN